MRGPEVVVTVTSGRLYAVTMHWCFVFSCCNSKFTFFPAFTKSRHVFGSPLYFVWKTAPTLASPLVFGTKQLNPGTK